MARNDDAGATRLGARNGRDREYDETRDADGYVSADGRRAHESEARDKFGGVNLGASFFGWIVAIGIAILLTSIVGAIGTAVGFSGNLSQTDAERQAGTIGIVSAIVLLVVLMVAYYAGGYVAGRMSRFDGGRQGFMVWLIGLLVTILAIVLGAVFGSKYNILDRVSLPRLPVSFDQIGWGALITALAVIVLTMLSAVMGGKVGHRYHDRVDRVASR
jgi:heme/copper-type cytochrome/quinol oxidase subunit 1